MNEQGWDIKDVYRNTTRDDMPNDETLTGLENTLIEAARITIKNERRRTQSPKDGTPQVYRIPTEHPANIEPLATQADQIARLRKHFAPATEKRPRHARRHSRPRRLHRDLPRRN